MRLLASPITCNHAVIISFVFSDGPLEIQMDGNLGLRRLKLIWGDQDFLIGVWIFGGGGGGGVGTYSAFCYSRTDWDYFYAVRFDVSCHQQHHFKYNSGMINSLNEFNGFSTYDNFM